MTNAESVRPNGALRVLYVCDFASSHARGFVEAVVRRGDINVTVVTSRAAASLPNVRLMPLFDLPGRPRPRWLLSFVDWSRASLERFPSILQKAWGKEVEREATLLGERLLQLIQSEQPDVIHAFRLLPEGLAALALAQRYPTIPFAASIWGQDLVYFAAASRRLNRWTRQLLERVDILIPDTVRDAVLARDSFGLRATAAVRVLPGSGGLDIAALEKVGVDEPMIGDPAITCFRAWTADTFSVAYLLDAHQKIMRTHARAHLHLVVPNRPRRVAEVMGRIKALEIQDSVTLRVGHVPHAEVIRQMRGSTVNVLIGATDGLPMTMLESLYCGQVQVALNRSSYIPPLTHGGNAALFERIDGASIAEAIVLATDLARRRSTTRLQDRQLLTAQYARERGIASIVEMYHHAIAAKQEVSTVDGMLKSHRP